MEIIAKSIGINGRLMFTGAQHINGKHMKIYGNLLKSMEINGNLWKSIEIYRNQWKSIEK